VRLKSLYKDFSSSRWPRLEEPPFRSTNAFPSACRLRVLFNLEGDHAHPQHLQLPAPCMVLVESGFIYLLYRHGLRPPPRGGPLATGYYTA
jgi:hypothetical protein